MMDIWKQAVDMDDETPLYMQLKRIISSYIVENELKPGDTIPSEGEFCSHYGISRTTVRQAFKLLENSGRILRRRGLGSFVSEPKIKRNLDSLYSFSLQLGEMGYETSSRILVFAEETVTAEKSMASGIAVGTPVYHIERIRLADSVPLLLERTCIVKEFCPSLNQSRVETGSLYLLLLENGLEMDCATESYEPVLMDDETMRLLAVDENPCAFSICRKGYAADGRVFEYTRSVMPGLRSRLEITLRQNSVKLKKF